MADASCSGTTPFKQLVDHQARDVSHHQDRLVNHPASHHGAFRSTPQHGQGQPGFGAFMDGSSGLPEMASHPSGRLAAHAAALEPSLAPTFGPQAHSSPAPDMANWAADFRRFANQPRAPMQASQPSPMQMNQMNHQSSQPNFAAAFAQPNAGFSPMYGQPNGGFMNPNQMGAQGPVAQADFDQEMSRWMESNGAGNVNATSTRGMEDVDAVMDQMARELALNEAALPAEEVANEADNVHFTDLDTPEIGSLSLESQNAQAEPEEQTVNDTAVPNLSLAETAAKLLQAVRDEDGEKWKNSSFLSLMRDFRDGKKDIVDNEVRQMGGQPVESEESRATN